LSPKLVGNSLTHNRELRRQQLVSAALSLALESGVNSVTVTSVARKAKLSRTSVYEYFSSSADLITDLIVEEMDLYANRLAKAISPTDEPIEQVRLWISEALAYIADGRHMLAKSLSTITTPDFRKDEVTLGHKKIMATIIGPMSQIKFTDLSLALSLLNSSIDAAAVNLDSGKDKGLTIKQVTDYVIAGLQALRIS
jgi:AcrR family transcriptional regulator